MGSLSQNESPEARTMGAIAQNESLEAKPMGAIAENESSETKAMGAITENEAPEAKTMGAIAQNEAPEAIWTKLPWKWVSRSHLSFLSKKAKKMLIFPRQNVVNFNTKLITFWQIA